MSWLGRLFGAKPKETPSETYNGFRITPEAMNEGGQYRLCARITLGEGDDMQSHLMIRADTFNSFDAASDAATLKAKQLIDQRGAAIFQ